MSFADNISIFSNISNQIKPDVDAALYAVRNHFDVGNVTYHLSQTVVSELSVDAPYVKTTYPDAWVSRYLLSRYIEIDPIVREGMMRALPFEWSQVKLRPNAYEMMADFAAHGFSMNGYTIPIIDKLGRRSLFSLNARADQDDWSEIVSTNKIELTELAYIVHKMAVAELFGPDDQMPSLGNRELEVLTWTARGKNYLDIAMIMEISEHTVRSYLRSARAKLDSVNLTQAVIKATKLRLIRP